MKPATFDRFHTRLQRVADHLAAHLDEPLRLDQLADIAHLSPFHFHRIWTALVGETLAATLRRLRLQRAAHQLRTSSEPVSAIALAAGFATAQAFARSFRAAAGVTPSDYRSAPTAWPAWRLPDPDEPAPLEVRLIQMEPLRIVAKRRTGAYTDADLALDFQMPWDWATAQGCMDRLRGIYGVPWNDPEVAEVPIFFAGLDLGPIQQPLPPTLEHLTLSGGSYAVARLHGSYAGIDALVAALYRDWLSGSSHEPADAPLFHHYLNDPEATPEHELLTDLYLPLQASAERESQP